MKRRSVLATSPCCYVLLTLLAMALDSLVSAEDPMHPSQAPISIATVQLDAAAMETLCSDQIGMCTVSCQSKVQDNSCDAKTLSWTCTCKNGTRSMFGDWQLPVPFQLCRRQLSSCLQNCDSLQQQTLDRERKASMTAAAVLTRRTTHGLMDGSKQEIREKSLDVTDEFQFARHSAKVQAASFSRNNKPQRQQSKQRPTIAHSTRKGMRKKSKHERWKRALGQSNVGAETAFGDEKNKAPAPAVYSMDPPVPRDPICVARCERQFSCGTRYAPEYHNLNDFLTTNDTPNNSHSQSKDSTTVADVKQRNSKINGPESGRLCELRLSILTTFAAVVVSITATHYVTQ